MSDAQYVIDIAASVSGAEASSSEIESLASQLNGSGANAAMFEDALTGLTSKLGAASEAAAAANAAVAAGRAQYKSLSDEADRTAQKVARLENNLTAAQAGMAAAQSDLDAAVAAGASDATIKRLSKAADEAAKNLRKASSAAEGLGDARQEAAAAEQAAVAYAKELDVLEKEANAATAAQKKLADTLATTQRVQGKVEAGFGRTAKRITDMRGALADVGGPLGGLASRMLAPMTAFADLNESFGRTKAIAMVAGLGLVAAATMAVTAILAVGAAAVTVGIGLAAFAMRTSDAARSLALAREAAAIATPALAGLPWAQITDKTGIASDRLSALASDLAASKIPAADMALALEAAAKAEAALGDSGAAKMIEGMKAGKVSVEEFAATIESKYGGVVARKMLGLEAQGARLKRNLEDMFTFNSEPALKGLSTLVGLFDKSSTTGRSMRAALEGLLDPLIANAQTAAYVVEAFALGVTASVLRVYIAVKPAVTAIADLLGIDPSKWSLESVLNAAAIAGKIFATAVVVSGVVLGALVGGVILVVAVLGGLVAGVIATATAITALPFAAAAALGYLAVLFAGKLGEALSAVAGFASSLYSTGVDLVAGLAKGIASGASMVVSAITGVVKGAITAAKGLLGIASPSKIFGEIGSDTAEGFSGGVDAGTDAAQSAVAALVAPPDSPSASAAPSSTSTSTTTSSTKATTIHIASLTLPGVADPAAFLAWIEGLAERTA